MKSAGDAYVTAVESFSAQNPGLTGTYMDSKSAKAEKRARINLLDLKEQGVGEAHVFFKSRIIRANLFYMDPGPAKAMRLNVLLKVEIPKDEVLYTLVKSIEDFESLVKTQGVPQIHVESDEDLEKIVARTKEQSLMIDAIDRGINVLFELHKQTLVTEESAGELVGEPQEAQWQEASIEGQDSDTGDSTGQVEQSAEERVSETGDVEKEQRQYIDILMRIKLSKREKEAMAVEEDIESYGLPLIDQAKLTSSSMYLLRQLGRSKSDADDEIKRTTSLIKEKSLYKGDEILSVSALSERIETLVKALSN